jgi:concanavalin A-like lectin/glucanase superfamily protein
VVHVRTVLPPVLASLTVLTLGSPLPATAAGPQVRLSPAAGAAGGMVVLDGTSFGTARRVRIGLAGHRSRPVRVAPGGTYHARVTVPQGRRGWVTIITRSRHARVVSRFFAATGAPDTVEFAARRGRLRATPATLLPGAALRLRGRGYHPHRRLQMAWAGVARTVTPDRHGRFAFTVVVPPALTPGAWPGRLTGRGVALSFSLAVLPPPAPAPPPPAPLPPPPPPPPAGPAAVALWHMDDPAGGTVMHDAVGGHDGTLEDSVSAGAAGVLGTAFAFTHGSVSVPSAPALNPAAANVTLTIHLMTTTAPASPDWDLLRKGLFTSAGGEYKVEYQPTGQASCGFMGSKGSSEIIAGPSLKDGAWHTVQCVKTATTIALVVDGQTFSKAATIGSIANSADLVIGARPGSEFFVGSLDEASVVVG